MQQPQPTSNALQEIIKDHVQSPCTLMSKSSMMYDSPTKVGLRVTRMPYKNIKLVKVVLKAGKYVQQKCHVKLIFMVQRYLGRVGPQPSNLMKEE
jgi:hypothetical protein